MDDSTYLISLHLDEYGQILRYYPFAVDLGRRMESCNTLNDLSGKLHVPDEKKDLNLIDFNMITGINKSKILKKHISSKCACKFDSRKCNSNQKWNNETCQCEYKNCQRCKEDYSWNPCIYKNSKDLKKVADDLKIVFDEIISVTHSLWTNVTSALLTNFHNMRSKI